MAVNKRENFVRLAENRVNTAIKTLRLIGNLANRSNYTYSAKDVETIFRALERELKAARGRFESGAGSLDPEFRLAEQNGPKRSATEKRKKQA